MRYVEQMKEELPQGLFGAEALKMHYLSTITCRRAAMLPQIEDAFRQRLLQARIDDQKTGYTSVGPHRDDLKLYVNGKSLVDFGSAGQQRSSLLSLYFSQMEIHRKIHGFYPVFLVDDAEAELDKQRLDTFLKLSFAENADFFNIRQRFSSLRSCRKAHAILKCKTGMILPFRGTWPNRGSQPAQDYGRIIVSICK